MARISSSMRSWSPPPAYSKHAPRFHPSSESSEWAPLIKRPNERAHTQTSSVSSSACLLILLALAFIIIFPLAVVFLYREFNVPPPPIPTYSVAIVGAGPAGISAAQQLHLKTRTRGFKLDITLFESAPLIGGKLALNSSTGRQVFPYDNPVQDPITAEDIAGTALMWNNPLFTKASEETLRDQVQFSELDSQRVSYFSGERVVSQTYRPYSKTPLFHWLGLIFHYGSSVWSAGAMAKEGVELRNRFVDPPLESSVAQLIISLGLTDAVQQPSTTMLQARGIGGAYVTEVLSPQVERAHFQKVPDISGLAMMLAAAQEDSANSYTGGQLLDRLEQIVSATGATVRESTEVRGLKYEHISEEEWAWLVQYSAPGLPDLRVEAFDRVIIAAPSFNLYDGVSAEDVESASALAYRPVHIIFFTVSERLNRDVYGDADQVLFLEEQSGGNAMGGVRELRFLRQVVRIDDDGNGAIEYLYLALADEDVTELLQQRNLGITWSYQTRLEHAYPYLIPSTRFPPFKLSKNGLWWTSAIHLIASTVDMSWLAGKIVAEQLIEDLPK